MRRAPAAAAHLPPLQPLDLLNLLQPLDLLAPQQPS